MPSSLRRLDVIFWIFGLPEAAKSEVDVTRDDEPKNEFEGAVIGENAEDDDRMAIITTAISTVTLDEIMILERCLDDESRGNNNIWQMLLP
jgi:hypothetical protein